MILVASYNMRKAIGTDRRRNPERILDVLNEVGADVVALQEADRRFGERQSALPLHLIEAHTDLMPVPFGARDGSLGWHGNAILVRKSAEIIGHEMLHLPSLEPRGAVMADVRVHGAALRVVGMHLDLSGLWRRRQAHAILHKLEHDKNKLPTVLMGDLNEWSAAGGCLRDFGHHHHFADCGRSFHARRPVAQLDRIMVSQGVEILDSGAHQSATARKASDHLPIWARIRSGSSPERGGGSAER